MRPLLELGLGTDLEDPAAATEALFALIGDGIDAMGRSQDSELLKVVLGVHSQYRNLPAASRRKIAGETFRGGEAAVGAGTIRQHHEPRALKQLAATLAELRPSRRDAGVVLTGDVLTRFDESDWLNDYRESHDRYEAFSERLGELLQNLLHIEGIDVAQLEVRAKSPQSLAEKVARLNLEPGDALREVSDLIGVRVIVYSTHDVPRVGTLLEREFRVDDRRSAVADKPLDHLAPSHYVLSLTSARSHLPEWRDYRDLAAEVQVRTVLQQAWALLDRKLVYKSDTAVPSELHRSVSRMATLLEIADEQFASLDETASRLDATHRRSIATGDLSAQLDALTLRAYLEETGASESWAARARSAGFLDASAASQDVSARRVEVLLDVLVAVAVHELQSLDELLRSAEPWADESLSIIAGNGDIYAIGEDVIALLSLLSRGDVATIESAPFRPEIQRRLLRAFEQRRR